MRTRLFGLIAGGLALMFAPNASALTAGEVPAMIAGSWRGEVPQTTGKLLLTCTFGSDGSYSALVTHSAMPRQQPLRLTGSFTVAPTAKSDTFVLRTIVAGDGAAAEDETAGPPASAEFRVVGRQIIFSDSSVLERTR